MDSEYGDDAYERIVQEAMRAQDPEPEVRRAVELVRRGVQTEFWAWLEKTMKGDALADVERLADPRTPPEMVGFLRGKIHARNEILRLPYTYVQVYDQDLTPVGETEEQMDNPTAGRPLSAYGEEKEE